MVKSPTTVATADLRSVLIYDGDCGFCTTSAVWFAERIGSHDRIAPWQSLDLRALGLTEAQVTTAAYWVDHDGHLYRGHMAAAHAVIAMGWPWKLAGLAMSVPPISWLASPIYKLIAKNRYRLPGSTDACKLNL